MRSAPVGASENAEVATQVATQRVTDQLRDAILRGELAPGDRLRQEEVAERFKASRLPVREALRILEAEGLTEHEPNKGSRVARLDMQELQAIYQVRERLEPLALTESIPHLEQSTIGELARVQDKISVNTDVTTFLALDRQFHLLSYSACRPRQITSIVTRLWNSTQHYRRAFLSITGTERIWIVNAEHGLLLDAIERRDTFAAELYLTGHIRRTRIELSQHPELFAR